MTQGIQKQKLESLGILASSVAHDLNNILTSVLGHVSFLRLSLADQPGNKDSLLAIEDGARRAAAITQKILDFARGQDAAFGPVDLRTAVESALKLVRTSIPERIQIEFQCCEEPVSAFGDENQLCQLFMNLTLNARDALPGGGKITVTVSERELDAPGGTEFSVPPGRYAVVQVHDNGHGIPADLQSRIFEPFFTTKTRQGTGLGLAIVASIVKLHSGSISVESKENIGTRFTVLLPACAAEDGKPDTDRSDDIPGGNEKILVVDDEEAVRTIVQRSLEHLGYEVVVAKDGVEALELYASCPTTFHLVIIDMIMPHMAGDELYGRLRSINSSVGVLLASGYSSDARTRAVLDNGGLGFIQKPFAVEELAREVRRCLDVKQD
ncbi:MAG: ATP-binding protein [Bdellovibrionota bacterium]